MQKLSQRLDAASFNILTNSSVGKCAPSWTFGALTTWIEFGFDDDDGDDIGKGGCRCDSDDVAVGRDSGWLRGSEYGLENWESDREGRDGSRLCVIYLVAVVIGVLLDVPPLALPCPLRPLYIDPLCGRLPAPIPATPADVADGDDALLVYCWCCWCC